jgi:hypothetical protein
MKHKWLEALLLQPNAGDRDSARSQTSQLTIENRPPRLSSRSVAAQSDDVLSTSPSPWS